jgi:hypothetical protein
VEDYILRSLTISTPKKYYSGYQIEKYEMGGACTTYRGEKKCIQGSGGETWVKETN